MVGFVHCWVGPYVWRHHLDIFRELSKGLRGATSGNPAEKPHCPEGHSNWSAAFPSWVLLGITSPPLPTNKPLVFSKGSPCRVWALKNKCQQLSDTGRGQFYCCAVFSRKCLHLTAAACENLSSITTNGIQIIPLHYTFSRWQSNKSSQKSVVPIVFCPSFTFL